MWVIKILASYRRRYHKYLIWTMAFDQQGFRNNTIHHSRIICEIKYWHQLWVFPQWSQIPQNITGNINVKSKDFWWINIMQKCKSTCSLCKKVTSFLSQCMVHTCFSNEKLIIHLLVMHNIDKVYDTLWYRWSFHELHCSRNAHLQEQSRTSVHSQVSRDLMNPILKT